VQSDENQQTSFFFWEERIINVIEKRGTVKKDKGEK
jgi:hypothetical protein